MADSLREGANALDDFADKAHELLSEIGVILAKSPSWSWQASPCPC
ncbi:hypothetical protein ACWEWK_06480 [Streptomyces sp. NPDC003757]